MTITKDRFRLDSDDELPHPQLLRWHYAQCVKGHIRGFPARMMSVTEQAENLRSEAVAALQRNVTDVNEISLAQN